MDYLLLTINRLYNQMNMKEVYHLYLTTMMNKSNMHELELL